MTELNQFIHARTLLKHVFTVFSKTRNGSIQSSNSTNGNTSPPTITLSIKSLSLDSSNKSISTSAGESEEDDEINSTTDSSINESLDEVTEDDKMDSIIDLLEDSNIDEEDRPELLKELLSSLLIAPNSEPLKLDPLILQLLHRHLEDLNPTTNPVPPLPTYSSLTTSNISRPPTISRSSSFRNRNLTPTMSPVHAPQSTSSINHSSSSVSSASSNRSTPNSPFRPNASPPSHHTTTSTGSKFFLNPSSNNTPSHSPWSSPRFAPLTIPSSSTSSSIMSAQAQEFKFSPGASEFRPGSASGTGTGHNSPSGSTNGRNSISSAREAQANWAFTSSPLGTPKYSNSPSLINATGAGSNNGSPSYFPRTVSRGLLMGASGGGKKVKRLPWADSDNGDTGDEAGEQEDQQEEEVVEENYPRIDQQEEEYGHQGNLNPNAGGWDPFSSNGSNYQNQNNQNSNQSIYPNQQGYSTPNYNYNYDGEFQPEEGYIQGEYSEYDNSNGLEYDNNYEDQDQEIYEDSEELEGGEGEGGEGFEREIGLGGLGAYSMTPFDVLVSVFAGSEVSPAILEEALVMSGWDIDNAIEYIIETQPGGTGQPPNSQNQNEYDQDQRRVEEELDFKQQQQYVQQQQSNYDPYPLPVLSRTVGASGSRPLIVSRDSFEGFTNSSGNGGNFLPPNNRNNSNPNSTIGLSDPNGRGVGGRVCRYYLSGSCLRSDCKFSHDVGKAVCKFWLRGHCLKGEGGRCDFLHSIPPIMRADYEARARQRTASSMSYLEDQQQQSQYDEGPDLDFPTLGTTRTRRNMNNNNNNNNLNGQVINNGSNTGVLGIPINRLAALDPTRSRFALAVKFGTPSNNNSALASASARTPPIHQQSSQIQQSPNQVISRDSLPPPRYSARLHLRPPALLPTLPTGKALSQLYKIYRTSFLQLGNNRNKCLNRAAESWKKGDGKNAKKFSLEAQNWNKQVALEGRLSANKIVEERKRLLKEALVDNRQGSTDDSWDRKVRGTEKGGGIVLGVASTNVLPRGERTLTVEERTEVALDLHGLHSDEAVSFIGDFLQRLEKDRFLGLAFIIIGQGRHSGGMDPGGTGAAAKRLRLEQACSEFLSNQGWAWQSWSGIISVDPLR